MDPLSKIWGQWSPCANTLSAMRIRVTVARKWLYRKTVEATVIRWCSWSTACSRIQETVHLKKITWSLWGMCSSRLCYQCTV